MYTTVSGISSQAQLQLPIHQPYVEELLGVLAEAQCTLLYATM